MAIAEDLAETIANELRAAASTAKERGSSAVPENLNDTKFPNFPLPAGTKGRAALTERLQRLWLANLIRDSIDASVDVLEGLVWLAACQHDRGIALIERGLTYRSANVWEKYHEGMWNPITLTIDTLTNEDLPALVEHRKVLPGIFARVFAGVLWETVASPYLDEILEIFARVKYDVAVELEG